MQWLPYRYSGLHSRLLQGRSLGPLPWRTVCAWRGKLQLVLWLPSSRGLQEVRHGPRSIVCPVASTSLPVSAFNSAEPGSPVVHLTSKKRKTRSLSKNVPRPRESRAAEAVTVAWMLATFATAVAQLGSVVAYALVGWTQSDGASLAVSVLPGLLLFIATLTGLVCVALTVVAGRIRRTPAPRAVSFFSICIGILPVLAVLTLSLTKAS